MKTVSVINHKGGVGKTTMAGCLAQALALSEYRVLALDNDSQHNLSTLMGLTSKSPSIRDVYRAKRKDAAGKLLKSIRKTEIENLHMITAEPSLCAADIDNPEVLKNAVTDAGLERYYDYLLIDNAPGLDTMQATALYASDEIFVPTELRQFAVDGIVEMEQILHARFPDAPGITWIIPNFYRNTKRQNSFILALQNLFPGRVTETPIPTDSVFDELITEGKILFLHRLYSKGAAFYLKIMHELFGLSEDDVWEHVREKRHERLSEEARKRYYERKAENEGA